MSLQAMPLVRASVLRPFVSAFEKSGCDVEALLAEHGMSLAVISLDDVFVLVQSWYDFANQAAKQLNDPYFGYNVGHGLEFAALPALRMLKPQGVTLGETLSSFIADRKHYSTLGKYTLTIGDQWANFKLQRRFKPSSRPAQIDAFGFGFLRRIVKNAVGQDWDASKFSAAISDPKAIPPGAAEIGQLARSPTDQASYMFPARWLFLHEGADGSLPDIGKPEALSIAVFRQIMNAQLAKSDLTVHEAAGFCGRSVRSLQRMLSAEGTNFRVELNRLRQDRAEKLLAGSDLTISSIANLLGYNEAAAFSHAFKKRTGINPSNYRSNNRAQNQQ